MEERLQKIMSQWGIASRRHAESMILDGRVRLNGRVAQLGQKANPSFDAIEIDGVLVKPTNRPSLIYLLLHKPAGIVSTCHDPQNRPTILNLLPPELQSCQGIHPVGRLDADSTGALLLTNDGAFTFRLTHPSHHIFKTYHVCVQGHPSRDTVYQWQQGVDLAGVKTLPGSVSVLSQNPTHTLLEIKLAEGRNRQIRRVAEQLGHPVISLHRTAIGSIHLDPLLSGHVRPLQLSELHSLQTSTERIVARHHADR